MLLPLAALILASQPAVDRGAWVGTMPLCRDTVRRVAAARNRYSGEPTLIVTLTGEGRRRLAALTTQLVGREMPIRVDGRIVSRPQVLEPVRGGRFELNGSGIAAPRLTAIVGAACPS